MPKFLKYASNAKWCPEIVCLSRSVFIHRFLYSKPVNGSQNPKFLTHKTTTEITREIVLYHHCIDHRYVNQKLKLCYKYDCIISLLPIS